MDISTSIGMVVGFGTIVVIILIDGGNFAAYFDKHAVIVIFGGTIGSTIVRFPFAVITGEITRIAEVVRKSGPMALENVSVEEPFLAQGLRYIADGFEKDFIRHTMETDRDLFLQRLDEGSKVYRAMGDVAPAWGMIGTILGMVVMFANMSDPSKLGPAMATALLATLYGAVVSNAIALPIADKLHVKMQEEELTMTMIIDGILQIRDSKSPSIVREMLLAYIPSHDRAHLVEAD
jgi:chemotaxis protein MotA